MEDTAIIDLYWARDEAAVQESDRKYGAFCRTIALNIVYAREDAEECVNDTWLRAWNAMPPARPSPLRAFLGRITRNLSLDRYRAARAQKRGGGEMEYLLEELGQCVPGTDNVEGAFDAKETARIFSRFLDGLPPMQRQVFLRRYWFGDGVSDIAARFSMREGTVKSNLHRIREKLRLTLEQGGGGAVSKREHLFEAIGLVDDHLIEEAADAPTDGHALEEVGGHGRLCGAGHRPGRLVHEPAVPGCGASMSQNTTSDSAAPVTEETTETTEGTAPEEPAPADTAEPEAAGDEDAADAADDAGQTGGNGAYEGVMEAAEVPVLGIYAGDGLTVERRTSMVCVNGGATVSDTYLLTNTGDEELTVEMSRPEA